jgi:hypothetical protein
MVTVSVGELAGSYRLRPVSAEPPASMIAETITTPSSRAAAYDSWQQARVTCG